jgi:hypothetical protein
MKNNQDIKKHGGYRPGSGRKKGAGEKLRASVLLNEIYKTNKRSYAQILVDELNKSIVDGDTKLTAQYLQWIGNKVVADKVEMDHTTAGQPLQAIFQFPQRELPDWTNVEKKITIKE